MRPFVQVLILLVTAFAHANSLRVSVEKNYIQAYVGEDVRLKCMIADVEEGLLVEWFIGDTKIWEVNPATGKNLAFLNYHGRVTGSSANLDDIFNNGHSLSFRPVKESDASHYKCRARNVKDDSQGEESIQLAVALPPKVMLSFEYPASGPQLLEENEKVKIICRSNAEGKLGFYKNDMIQYECQENGKYCETEYTIGRNDHDRKVWECQLSFNKKRYRSEKVAPQVRFLDDKLDLTDGSSYPEVELKCTTGSSNPPQHIVWKRSDRFCVKCCSEGHGDADKCEITEKLTYGNSDKGTIVESTLEFKANALDDYGNYSCEIEGKNGVTISQRAKLVPPANIRSPYCGPGLLRDKAQITVGEDGELVVEQETLHFWSFGVGIATGCCLLVFFVGVIVGVVKYRRYQRAKRLEAELKK